MATLAVDDVVTPLATEPVLVIDQPSELGFEPRSAMALNRVRADRGNGTAAKKSAEFESASTAPSSRRRIAVVFEGAAATVPSAQFAPEPYPTLSTSVAFRLAQLFVVPDCAAVRSAMLPAVADRSTDVPAASASYSLPFTPRAPTRTSR